MLISKNYNYTRKVPRLTVQKWVRCTYTLVLGTSFEIAFSCINKRLPAFLVVFEAVLESTFWNGLELFCNGWMACTSAWRWPFNTRFSRGNKKKKSKSTNLENMAHATVQWFDVLTPILWRITPYAAANCRAKGTTRPPGLAKYVSHRITYLKNTLLKATEFSTSCLLW